MSTSSDDENLLIIRHVAFFFFFWNESSLCPIGIKRRIPITQVFSLLLLILSCFQINSKNRIRKKNEIKNRENLSLEMYDNRCIVFDYECHVQGVFFSTSTSISPLDCCSVNAIGH